jgi:hypothetical protein
MALNLAIPSDELEDPRLSSIDGQMRDLLRTGRTGRPATIPPGLDRDAAGIEKLSAASAEQIDAVVGDLHTMRHMLLGDAERVQSEITAYTEISKSALGAARNVRTTLMNWNQAAAGV